MKKEDLILDIKTRFSLGKEDFKDLEPHEVNLIYEVYPKLSKEYLDKVIKDYGRGKIKPKTTRKYHNRDQPFDKEEHGRGVFKSLYHP